ncbi:D-sedoheptulose 7-phosphate isomerase [Edaphobacter albus]|uniref:D-sedoheptulose 7-phosphate isomerase n=1 Tax=Edaphobacter sp. 4G125 TaxID=2763071 RepID=UPI0016440011|nr:D-sedoheptulose 7-phosphate isomerase [Edaphobacter sp. 4G125]QNI36467.1 D-sedoheptulose 7-phosphate isomerase [Edaphobacter sp. 4G125]
MQNIVETQLDRSIATLTAVRQNKNLIDTVVQAAQAIAQAMKNGNKLLVAGNGGSAADAQHLVAEFVGRLTRNRPALPAVALTTDTSILTAVGNDFSFDDVFDRQVEAIGKPGDVFLGISTSGNSRNLVKALHRCRDQKLITVGYLGNKGGTMAPLCDYPVIVPSNVTMQIQESHLALEHILCLVVERYFFGEGFDNIPQYVAE